MMSIKKLIWRDNITEKGKEKGMFYIMADVLELNLKYSIRNYKYYSDPITDKFYFFSSLSDTNVEEFNTLEEAYKRAQEHFKEYVLDKFFE